MFTRRLKSTAAAAVLALTLVFAYQTFAGTGPTPSTRAVPAADLTVLRGRGVARFGGYELNIAFTPEGRLLCFDIARPAAGGATPKG